MPLAANEADLPYNWNGTNYNTGGTFTFITSSSTDCDSLAILYLTVNVPPAPAAFNYATPNTFIKDTTINDLMPAIEANGQVTQAGISPNQSAGMAKDGAGNIYIADLNGQAVFKIAADGKSSLFASNIAAPFGVATDAAGNVYVSDLSLGVVYKITPDGANRSVYASGFATPYGIAIDAAGNLYVVQVPDIKKVAPDGTTTTVWTDNNGGGSIATDAAGNIFVGDVAGFITEITAGGTVIRLAALPNTAQPAGIATDITGNLYVTDSYNSLIYKIAPGGALNTFVSSGLNGPIGIVADAAGNVWVADSYNHFVKRIARDADAATGFTISPALPSGLVMDETTGIISGTPSQAAAQATYTVTASNGNGLVTTPVVITVVNKKGEKFDYNSPNVYVKNKAIAAISPVTSPGVEAAGTQTALGHGFVIPYGVAVGATGNVYVSNTFNNTVHKISADGSTITQVGSGFNGPSGLAVDANGNLYVADLDNGRVKKVTPAGVITSIGSGFFAPSGVAVDAAGNVYVADLNATRIKKISTTGITSNVGPTTTGLSSPGGVAVDAAGNVYAADFNNGRIRKITPANTVSTIISGLFGPNDVKVDAAGNIYVADQGNSVIKKYSSTGTFISTIGTSLVYPAALDVDAAGNVYIANTYGNTIEKVAGAGQVITTYSVSPALPDGLGINSATGIISGTPTKGSPATVYTVTAARTAGNLTTPVSIQVNVFDTTAVTVCAANLPYHWNGNDYSTPGTYTAHLTSAEGVDSTATIVLTIKPGLLTATLTANNQFACFDAKRGVVVTAAGNSKPYTYSIDGGANWQPRNSFPVVAGTYTVMVKDTGGCTLTTNSVTITQPAAKLAVSAVTGNNTIIVTASDGFGGYLYNLNGGTYQASNILTGYHAGADTVFVKDAQGCIVKKVINTLTATVAAENGNSFVCLGQKRKINITVKGGQAPLLYSLDGTNFQSNKSFNIGAGTYIVTVKDGNNNTFTTDAITINTPSSAPAIEISRRNVTCLGGNDGRITVQPADGTSVYTYQLAAGAYGAENVFTNLTAGKYALRAMDSYGCVTSTGVFITEPATPCESLGAGGDNPTGNSAEIHGELKVKVMPNPAQVEFNLQVLSGDSKKIVELRVMDMMGKVVYHTQGSVFDMYRFGRTFAGGMYIAEVLNGKNIQRIKLVKGN